MSRTELFDFGIVLELGIVKLFSIFFTCVYLFHSFLDRKRGHIFVGKLNLQQFFCQIITSELSFFRIGNFNIPDCCVRTFVIYFLLLLVFSHLCFQNLFSKVHHVELYHNIPSIQIIKKVIIHYVVWLNFEYDVISDYHWLSGNGNQKVQYLKRGQKDIWLYPCQNIFPYGILHYPSIFIFFHIYFLVLVLI